MCTAVAMQLQNLFQAWCLLPKADIFFNIICMPVEHTGPSETNLNIEYEKVVALRAGSITGITRGVHSMVLIHVRSTVKIAAQITKTAVYHHNISSVKFI